jgi:hypothetical protein
VIPSTEPITVVYKLYFGNIEFQTLENQVSLSTMILEQNIEIKQPVAEEENV